MNMISGKKNISNIVHDDLCVGCGLCVDICPTKSIRIREENGLYKAFVSDQTCNVKKGCNRCLRVCPGAGIELAALGNMIQEEQRGGRCHSLIGMYKEAYSGFAVDTETRYHGASGGLLSALLAFLLDRGYISAAVVVENDLKQPFLNRTVLVHSSSELKNTRSSKYCPVKYDGIVNQIKKESGRVIVVGLPCVIHGFRKYEIIDKRLKEKIFGYFGLYCSCGRSFNLTEYVFKRNKIDRKTLSYFQYRDNGCLGNLVADDKNGRTEIPFEMYYHPLRSFFIPNRCQFCIDHYAELADVSFGDIHYGVYKEDKTGINSVVIRNVFFDELIKKAEEDGYIRILPLTEEELIFCQASAHKKKGRVGGVLRFANAIGKKIPEYDIVLTKYNYYKSIAYYLFAKSQMFVGK